MKFSTMAALACAAGTAASAAMAQSNVQLYGRINTSVEHQSYADQRVSGLSNNGSFFGIRGQEDLGNGLKAGFVLESAFQSDDGAAPADEDTDGINFKRRSELNLQGGFGMLRMGTFDKYSYTLTADAIAWHNDDAGVSSDEFFAGNYRRNNSLAYRTPTWGGVHAELGYHFGEKRMSGTYRDNNAWDLGVNYANGPWGLGLGLNRAVTAEQSFGDRYVERSAILRASYTADQWALGAYYQYYKEKGNLVDIGPSRTQFNVLRLAAMYRMNASEFHVNVGHSKFRLNDWESSDGVSYAPYDAKSSRMQWTVAYHYNFSPRSKAYVFYSHNDDIMPWHAFSSFRYVGENRDFRSIGVGVRHLF